MGRVLQPFEYVVPASLPEAIAALSSGASVLAGGVDLVLNMRRGAVQHDRLVSILHIPSLGEMSAHPKKGIHIGAAVKINRLARDIWVSKRFSALHEAVDQYHPPHIRNMGTVVGNICSATPYTDIPPALMALRTVVGIERVGGFRSVSLDEFYDGPRSTVVKQGEIVVSLFVPPARAHASSAFRKIYKAPRREGDLHKVNAAAHIELDSEGQYIRDATVVVGCCGPSAYRAREAEAALIGAPAVTESYSKAAQIAAAGLKPMTNAPWVEEIRAQFVRVLVRDVLEQAASRARMKHDHFEHWDEIVGQ